MMVDKETVVAPRASSGVNWGQVGLFVGLTFGLTWLIDLVVWQTLQYGGQASALLLQLQMLVPAFSAILLGTFVFRDSPIHRRVKLGRPRAFFVYFLIYSGIFAGLAAGAIIFPSQLPLFGAVGLGLSVLGLLLVLVLRATSGREAFARAGLAGGKAKYWLVFGAGVVLFYLGQALLNYLFGLGRPADLTPLVQQSGIPLEGLFPMMLVQGVVLGPFLGLLLSFGEEYGWRGYLQGELIKMGRVRGILLVGIIWGLWHAPVIAMGHNYPGYPVAGIFLMVAYSTGLAFVLGYAVLKSGSVWLAAFLHALNNQVYSFLVMAVYAPSDPVFSFGVGIYGILTLAVVVLLILRDPIWREGEGKVAPARA